MAVLAVLAVVLVWSAVAVLLVVGGYLIAMPVFRVLLVPDRRQSRSSSNISNRGERRSRNSSKNIATRTKRRKCTRGDDSGMGQRHRTPPLLLLPHPHLRILIISPRRERQQRSEASTLAAAAFLLPGNGCGPRTRMMAMLTRTTTLAVLKMSSRTGPAVSNATSPRKTPMPRLPPPSLAS